jgi:hypothetical protein
VDGKESFIGTEVMSAELYAKPSCEDEKGHHPARVKVISKKCRLNKEKWYKTLTFIA